MKVVKEIMSSGDSLVHVTMSEAECMCLLAQLAHDQEMAAAFPSIPPTASYLLSSIMRAIDTWDKSVKKSEI